MSNHVETQAKPGLTALLSNLKPASHAHLPPRNDICPKTKFCPALPIIRPVLSRLDQASSLDGAVTAVCAKMLQRKLLNDNLYPEYKSPALSTLLISKSWGFWGWLFALTIPVSCLIIGTVSGIIEFLALSNTLW